MLLILQIGDTLDVDSTGVTDDTIPVLRVYEIPDIVTYDHRDTNMQTSLLGLPVIRPGLTDVTLKEALFHAPVLVIDRGSAMPAFALLPGLDPKHSLVTFNGRVLNDPLSGTMDLNLLPAQFVASVRTGSDGYGITTIDLVPNINVYDRPYSTIGYVTGSFGHTGYIFELARAVDNDFGLYLDGLYRKADGYRANDEFETSALYANVYDGHLFPMRLDALVTTGTSGFPDRDPDTVSVADRRLIDISYTAGVPGHSAHLFFNDYTDQWHDSLQERTVQHVSRTYGLASDHCHVLGPVQVLYNATGLRREITSDIYGTHTFHALSAATAFNAAYKQYRATLSMRGVAEHGSFHVMPFFAAGLAIADPWTVFASVARKDRLPVLSETAPLADSTFGAVGTNDTLRAESYWEQALGFRSPFGSIFLFRHDFANRIIIIEDSAGFPVYANGEPWENTGASGALLVPVYLARDPDSMTTYTRCQFGVYGSYLFNEDTVVAYPRYWISGIASFSRQTPRFGITLATQGRTIGPRHGTGDPDAPLYSVLALSATVRFLTLSIAARVDNVLDADLSYDPDYPLAPRSLNVTIQWNFWY